MIKDGFQIWREIDDWIEDSAPQQLLDELYAKKYQIEDKSEKKDIDLFAESQAKENNWLGDDSREIRTLREAFEFFEWAKNENGQDCAWSIQYYGFGEHFTFWAGDGSFDDFNIDRGQAISWEKMKEILIYCANRLREVMQKQRKERLKNDTGKDTEKTIQEKHTDNSL